ncbi:MAG: MMPL family transporter, partial [Clostridiales Family XIII bacterium]|nr:MMPL family transporter [Clostridiales Family XIII bacterium]
MRKLFNAIVYHEKTVFAVFGAALLVCLLCRLLVPVNYDMNDYLPKDSPSTVAIDVMRQEFSGGIPGARVMVRGVSVAQALDYKERIAQVAGVTDVVWLDDAMDMTTPIETMDEQTVGTYYREGTALFSVTIDKDSRIEAVKGIRAVIGERNAMTGADVSTASATENTFVEIRKIAVASILFALFVLALTTTSWLEPLIVLAGLGVAVAINAGSNLVFGEISFVTSAAGGILQMAVSLDYSVFLIHRFAECRKRAAAPSTSEGRREAMVEALCGAAPTILASGLTTVIGFAALTLMRFRIGPDLGLALAKGIVVSLLTVFLLMPVLLLRSSKLLDRTRHRPLLPGFSGFAKLVMRLMIPSVCVFLLLIVPSFLASSANDFQYGPSNLFGKQTKVGADSAAIEEVFGRSDTYVLLVPRGDPEAEQALVGRLDKLPEVSSILSYAGTVGLAVPPEYVEADARARLLSQHYSRMVLTVDADYE